MADGTETMFLADMTGDGLSDIVRVRNGESSYWPNLGYGRFGTKVRWTTRRASSTRSVSIRAHPAGGRGWFGHRGPGVHRRRWGPGVLQPVRQFVVGAQ
jgi:hypothetical protein